MAKPKAAEAMRLLITQIKNALPFGMSEHDICAGVCVGCPKKSMEYIGSEIDYWECRLANNDNPTLGDISDLARIAKKVHRSMERNNLV